MKTNLILSRPVVAPGLLLVLALAGPMFGQAGGDHDLSWNVIGGGGGESYNRSGPHWLQGTIGQPGASPAMAGGTYSLTGGFWAVALPLCSQFAKADFDGDCDVDAEDLGWFEACALGPSVPYDPASLPPGCQLLPAGNVLPADFDADGDVDQDDFGVFQRCYSGAGTPADPNCGT